MKVLLVDDDDVLRSILAKELEGRGCEVHQLSRGDEAFYVWQQLGPWEFVLTDYRFMPGVKIKDGFHLLTAIHEINPLQRMAIMTAVPNAAQEKMPRALREHPCAAEPLQAGATATAAATARAATLIGV